ncbi:MULTISPECIES: hypothetical protein [Pseudomonas]|uniref:DNA primase n=1 Tax=Pseudomonas fluorescens TaxID=294 RepID=A0A166QNN7_PSEFL|nr:MULTISPECIES: hypothetical protein [Pseudomonas]KZN20595.1 hypothetical protein A1D17_03385 [Pseudomonas fluorescens]
MEQTISEFLRERVYPRIDAVERGLLDHFQPNSRLSGAGSYVLKCPACGEKEGFYFPGSQYIQCPRKNECGNSTSLWDAMLDAGYLNSEIVKVLCETAGVEPPKSDKQSNGRAANPDQPHEVSAGQAIFQATQFLAAKHPALLKELQTDRGLTNEQMEAMRLGVYTTPTEVLALLAKRGITREVAIEKGYVEVDPNDASKLTPGLTNRVVGYWPHPDGDVRLWGRLASGKGEDGQKKYRFASKMKKDIPYLFGQRKRGIAVGIEGTFDAWSFHFAGMWGMALGQASLNTAQAAFLAAKGVTEFAYVTDGDAAGYEGGLITIRNGESVGIVVGIVALGQGMDDADALRKAGKLGQLTEMVANRINAGEYLARMCSYYLSCTPPDIKGVNQVLRTADCLTPVSAVVWKDFSTSLGISMDLEREAATSFGNLLIAGLSVREAASIVQRNTGYRITINLETESNG